MRLAIKVKEINPQYVRRIFSNCHCTKKESLSDPFALSFTVNDSINTARPTFRKRNSVTGPNTHNFTGREIIVTRWWRANSSNTRTP